MRWAAFVLLVLTACIIETPDEPLADRPPVLAVNVSPASAAVEPGSSQQFTSTVIGNGIVPQAVTWSVLPASSSRPVGIVDAQGVYRVTAPVEVDARDYVVATSVANPEIAAMAPVDVPALSVTIAPTTADLLLGDSIQFTATVRGLTSKVVEWRCFLPIIPNDRPFGTIDANGLYTAPLFPPRYNFVDVEVRPAGDPRTAYAFASATVQLHLRPPVLTGASGPVRSGDTLTLFGSGFLPTAPGVQWQVLFESTSGGLGGSNPFDVQEDRLLVQVPFGGPWSGRLELGMWADSFEVVRSNVIDAGLPP
jgi:hypothetical protein